MGQGIAKGGKLTKKDAPLNKSRKILRNCVTILALFFVFLINASYASGEHAIDFTARKEIISQRLKGKGFEGGEIEAIFSDPRIALYPEILGKSGKGLNYLGRKFGLLTKQSIMRGQKVLSENAPVLKEIEERFGVSKEVLVAIYRVETNFGKAQGTRPVLNSLLTLAVLENRRSDWAMEELISFLVLCKNSNKDPFAIKGSWAGAFGLCQFIPSSHVRYAVDGDGDGEIDIFGFRDAMASIANYLQAHGWEQGNKGKMKKAIWSYNHCDNYVEAVLAYAEATRTAKKSS